MLRQNIATRDIWSTSRATTVTVPQAHDLLVEYIHGYKEVSVYDAFVLRRNIQININAELTTALKTRYTSPIGHHQPEG